ncbi:metallophosphoesterase family protein [Virgibacillus saliphilus]|uniref:metallophosphoesterase family protein n=1 Tax=Virgibacillus saliphilus TaxID=2831674 RepID=UPI0028154284|nr:metallophosphoesterase family protein [Virgibacillus sp. NKC19-3]
MRTFVISDIHGCLEEFMDLLEIVSYMPNKDRLVLAGDYVDRGPKSREVVDRIMFLAKHEHVVVLRGNHDERFRTLIQDGNLDVYDLFLSYGGVETLASYGYDAKKESIKDIIPSMREKYADHVAFINETAYFYEDEHFIVVHAGLNPNSVDWKSQPLEDFLSIRELFVNDPTNVGKRVIFGHTMTTKIHGKANVWFSDDKIGIDGGCAMGNRLNCLEITTEGEMKEHFVPARKRK